MKKIIGAAVAASFALGASVAAAPAASAAPANLNLPKGCYTKSINVAKEKEEAEKYGLTFDVYAADVHPNKGKEYVFASVCQVTDTSESSVLVVANSAGKVLASKKFNTLAVEVTSASKKNGIKFEYVKSHKTKGSKVTTSYYNKATYKWNTKSKKFVFKAAATPSWVKNLGTYTAKTLAGKSSSAISGTKSLKKKFAKNIGNFSKKSAVSVQCVYYKNVCSVFQDKSGTVKMFDFNFKKSGKTIKLTKVEPLLVVPDYMLS